MNDNEFENGEKKRGKVIIEDKRFTREDVAAEEKPKADEAAPKKPAHAHKHEHKAATERPAEGGQEGVNLFDIGIEGFIEYNLGMVLQFAWVYMGMAPSPSTGLIARDLERAKLCIDVFEFLAGKIKPMLPKEAQDELTRITKDMKLNFIQSAAAPEPVAAPAEDAPRIITPDSPKK